jgi:hypothetical protein
LRFGPLVAKDYRHLSDPQFAGSLQTEMAVHHLSVAPDETRYFEAELAD